jgi:hypothetical protein
MGRGAALSHASDARPKLARPEFHNELGMIFGASYDSAAVIPDGTALAKVANPVAQYVPCARPGSRAPHLWLKRGTDRVSPHDLLNLRFTLFTGENGVPWREAVRDTAGEFGVPLAAYTIGMDGEISDPEERWESAYDVEAGGAVLVRPDGHVAWRRRTSSQDPRGELRSALHTLLQGK